ncbi:M23 family metallopeptidase [Aliiglaciecola lipolytica]|uniref:M23/M37 peptidase domain-containing protein n=1 Tax=Aliiglaciecola lipolytica E3 TaxID=1127673 RepID=K6X4N8_9ALTE|nr:M23 family metallopeptidase [Aliiglaciecola lipolytica]GAC15594.1 M23/M37 peptidase domain-containing protein [Aliiglaciecola lipolytica E3]
MSLTLHYKGKSTEFSFQIGKRRLVAGFVLVCGLVLLSSRSSYQANESHARIEYAKSGLVQQQQDVSALKSATQQQLAGIMLNLADVQSQIQRVNALGSRLVEQAGLNQDEFGFQELPQAGGPITDSVITIQGNNELLERIDSMLQSLDSKTQQLAALESIMMNHHIDEQTNLEGRPITSGWLSSYYGVRKDPFSGLPTMHKGLDFAGKTGEPVVATGAGLVTWSGERYGYGNLVEIDHGNGIVTRYGHNKALSVKIGDVVTKGQEIALMGSTGRSTGAHVHYEVIKNGKQLDPLPFVYRK